jgi:regulator of cell morphogenesis and NO signaling
MTTDATQSIPHLTPDRLMGDLVREDYARAAVFRRHRLDFCCGGGSSLAEACEKRGADVGQVLAELAADDARRRGASGEGAPVPLSPRALVDHIEQVHHAWVRETLPVLLHFTGRVAAVHGETWPYLKAVAEHTKTLAAEMESHMLDEEGTLFPRIRGMAPGASPLTSEDLLELENEHAAAGALMGEIRDLTSSFTPPDHACATWRAAYAKLEEFEADLHRHVHLENNVLFPAVTGAGAA